MTNCLNSAGHKQHRRGRLGRLRSRQKVLLTKNNIRKKYILEILGNEWEGSTWTDVGCAKFCCVEEKGQRPRVAREGNGLYEGETQLSWLLCVSRRRLQFVLDLYPSPQKGIGYDGRDMCWWLSIVDGAELPRTWSGLGLTWPVLIMLRCGRAIIGHLLLVAIPVHCRFVW